MWEKIIDRLPSNMAFFSALLSLLLPMVIHKLNQKIHNYGDPPWKKQEKSEDLSSKNINANNKNN
ncbi:hypothetical protein [Alteribacillus bidgolensis]|uniref:Uncharacterized protein n=1 Tax=Alteribacillus bidgolensis TaxID=930129 RepID=A0A1G8EDA0_9BACI|nr:hypothetical protein [Alteribacillus bidgolensis]SDH67867.1 hypothetical protein SAMN05216352_102175 [Alteribacillus bidgolensis]